MKEPSVRHDNWQRVTKVTMVDTAYFDRIGVPDLDSAFDYIESEVSYQLNDAIGDMSDTPVQFTVQCSRMGFNYIFEAIAMVEQVLPWRVLDLTEYTQRVSLEEFDEHMSNWNHHLGFGEYGPIP